MAPMNVFLKRIQTAENSKLKDKQSESLME